MPRRFLLSAAACCLLAAGFLFIELDTQSPVWLGLMGFLILVAAVLVTLGMMRYESLKIRRTVWAAREQDRVCKSDPRLRVVRPLRRPPHSS